MLVLIWLVVFALVGFSLVDIIPRPTLDRISRSKSSPEEQIVIGKTSGINLPTSRLPNRYHDSCTFTKDISTQKSATRNGDLSRSETLTRFPDCIHAATKLCNPTSSAESNRPSAPTSSSVLGETEVTRRIDSPRFPKSNTQDAKTSDYLVSLSSNVASAETIVKAVTTPLPFGNSLHRAMRWPRTTFRGRVPRSNRLLLYKRQCSTVCENDEVSLCCEEGQFCATSNGKLICAVSTSLESQGFPSTSSTPTDVNPISSSQTMDSSSATEGPSSTAGELPTTSSTLTTTVAIPTTSASPTQLSTRQSSSAASDTQTSTTGSSPSSSSLPFTSVTSSSSPPPTSSITPTSGPATTSDPLATSGHTTTSGPRTASGPAALSGSDAEGNRITLGVGIGLGFPATVAAMIGAYYGVRLYYRRGL